MFGAICQSHQFSSVTSSSSPWECLSLLSSILAIPVSSQSDTVLAVEGVCGVWGHYLTVTEGAAFSLSAAQQQELWLQYSALKITLQLNCDSDPYHEFMPLESSFLITVICAESDLCPAGLQCPNQTQQHSLHTC
ncbi:hypothetical protein F7725_017945 [Dissostichus mawsoni]|uniref:Uncharacterized protein n=1 Tax=Dissostichus mawsoni TaxID=36200 RepID=A0A7J5XT03_DISMA|nr:hypothetical protein F7725_017945 [Dissostichus mawsoni]